MTENWTSAAREGKKKKSSPVRSFCFHCTRSFGNTVYPGLNCSLASLRAHRGAKGALVHAPSTGRSDAAPGTPARGWGGRGAQAGTAKRITASLPLILPPAASPPCSPRRRPARPGGCRAPVRYRRVELSTRRDVNSCAYFASLPERKALGCSQRLQLQPAPVLPPHGALPPPPLLFFFLPTPAAAAASPGEPQPAAGRQPLEAVGVACLGGGGGCGGR